MSKLDRELLKTMYVDKKMSVVEIAGKLKCSAHKVRYWMDAHRILRRSISEAIYQKHNPNGDPFAFRAPITSEDFKLFGLGLGLYWGEGTKADKVSVRLGNSNPEIIKKFIEFLVKIFSIQKKDCRFGLQLFNDIQVDRAMDFWIKSLKISRHQFYKPTISKSVSRGTYKKKAEYGVLTIYYHNKKLRDLMVSLLPM